MLEGLMMDRPLLISSIIDYAAATDTDGGLVSKGAGGVMRRFSYRQIRSRIAQLAHALRDLGIRPGDRVGTLAWNDHRHFELYYAISGIGAVCHTINPRLPASQIAWLIGNAGDKLLFSDGRFEALARLAVAVGDEKPEIIFLDEPEHGGHGDSPLYEDLLRGRPDRIEWPDLPEKSASGLCYTSGTTGNPKGVLYSHRSTLLHALSVVVGVPRSFGVGERILPAVPMFHANAWSLPFSAPLSGAALVMPGPALDGSSLFDLMETEGVTASWGVPTVWSGLIDEMRARGSAPHALRTILAGGSAIPPSMIRTFEEDFGIEVLHGWGMTELSPVGSVTRPRPRLDSKQARALKTSQGRPLFGVQLDVLDASGAPMAHDDESVGELVARGNSVVSGYFNVDAPASAQEPMAWFRTGDMARIGRDADLTIVDRAKDMIKSGGEWISSVDLENTAMGHPGIAQAAAIAIPHPHWGERPLLCIVAAGASPPSGDVVRDHLALSLAKWQIPDDIVVLESLPMTATGKISKLVLREMFTRGDLPIKNASSVLS